MEELATSSPPVLAPLCDRLVGVYDVGTVVDDLVGHLAITEDEWAAFVDDVYQSLTKFAVTRQEEEELTAIVESTHDAIVVLSALEQEPLDDRASGR